MSEKNMGPHMPLYLDRFLGGTMHFGADEIGAYILLIAHQWQYGHVEDDKHMIERVARCEYGRLRRVLQKFSKQADGTLINAVCAKVREDRQGWLAEQARRAKLGADARWNAQRHGGGDARRDAHPYAHTDTDTIYQLPNPTPKRESGGVGAANINPPSIEDCKSMATAIGLNETEVDEFYAYYDSQGWRKGNGQAVTNIRSALNNWKLRGQKFKRAEDVKAGKVDTRKSRFT